MPSVRENTLTIRTRLRNEGTVQANAVLRHTVLTNAQPVLTFTNASVVLDPAQSADVDVSATWSEPRLWCPDDPYLYDLSTMLETNSVSVDSLSTRFGFREVWCTNDSFYLNGTKLHLLATSCWPPTSLMDEPDIRQVLREVKAGNNVAFRLHTQPWNKTWYEVADEEGLLIVEEGAVWCDSTGYRLADPAFWTNFSDHLTAAVRRDWNHPSQAFPQARALPEAKRAPPYVSVFASGSTKPSRGNFRVLVHVGSEDGLDHAAVVEIPRGQAGLICSQLLLTTRFDSEPMAGVLLQRILGYCSASRPASGRAGLVGEADADAVKRLGELGLTHADLTGHLAACDLTPYPLLVVAGGAGAWNEAETSLGRLVAYVEGGGRLLLHRPTESFLNAAGPVLFPKLEWAPRPALPVLRRESSAGTWSFANHDLYWIDDPGDWRVGCTLSTNIAARVFRKLFTLTGYDTVEAEDMPVKTGGASITGGWCLNVNAYIAQTITFSNTASYLFGVLAYGTPAYGEYPRMVLRIDGTPRDAVVVDSDDWQLFSFAEELAAGAHEVALEFDNDAWDPPDDRNLYLDQLRYGPDPSPGDGRLLTGPGALVQVNRGAGFILLDETGWEVEARERTKADRLIASLLTDLGAEMDVLSGVVLEAEDCTPVGFGAYDVFDGMARCNSNGRLETSIVFSATATYSWDVTGFGTPAEGVYPELELRIDGVKADSVFVASETLDVFRLSADVTAGTHTVALAFVNDFYAPPEDRNLALDRFIVARVPDRDGPAGPSTLRVLPAH
ncbi:MAG: hypothetical protein JXR37_04760 [Kiritimatiellae bacterium]|nr:hypothetical protein [Kiritimatiellia bacterium]